MYVVLVTAHPHPEQDERFVAEMTRNASDSEAHEPGCIRFEYMRRSDEPHTYVLLEVYADREAFDRHRDTDHYRRWSEVSREILAEPMQVQTGEMVHPRSLGSASIALGA